MTLIDKDYLRKDSPTTKIQQLDTLISVRGINRMYTSNQYASINLFLHGTIEGKPAYAHLTREAHLGKPKSKATTRNGCVRPRTLLH